MSEKIEATQYAWEEIKSKFLNREIPLLPLKGILLKSLYPESYLRMMGDLDILYQVGFEEKVDAVLRELGYKFEKNHSDSTVSFFHRPTNINIEAHRALMPNTSPFFNYYSKIWQKAKLTESPYMYSLSKDDEYIFMLIHAYKHFYGGGTGVRTIVDFYLFNKTYADTLDKDYIKREIEEAENIAKQSGGLQYSLKEFDRQLSKLIDNWFKKEINIDEFGFKVICDGVYGSVENILINNVKKFGRKRYLIQRLFPSIQILKERFPLLGKLPFLLPIFWIWRFIYTILCRKKLILREIKIIKKQNNNFSKF